MSDHEREAKLIVAGWVADETMGIYRGHLWPAGVAERLIPILAERDAALAAQKEAEAPFVGVPPRARETLMGTIRHLRQREERLERDLAAEAEE